MSGAPHDLSGTWRGHYLQARARYGIAMEVAQEGARLRGRMRDEHTLIAGTEKLRGDDPGEDPTDYELLITLPEHSEIEGEVDGDRVSFVKRYLGKHTARALSERNELEVEIDGHHVLYAGHIEEGGAVLRGFWRIPPAFPGERGDTDRFELHRDSGRPQPSTA
ncbi:MAG: hypothetical protein IPN34_23720 [Planctomycetes bacterium]|nr:hypothetical protein [Planctomycetota bacterium]